MCDNSQFAAVKTAIEARIQRFTEMKNEGFITEIQLAAAKLDVTKEELAKYEASLTKKETPLPTGQVIDVTDIEQACNTLLQSIQNGESSAMENFTRVFQAIEDLKQKSGNGSSTHRVYVNLPSYNAQRYRRHNNTNNGNVRNRFYNGGISRVGNDNSKN
eukprot:gene10206-7150_t